MTDEELKTPHEKNHRVPQVSVGARVRFEVEVYADSSWGHDSKVDQVIRQGGEDALGKLQKVLATIGARIVSSPDVRMVWTEGRKP